MFLRIIQLVLMTHVSNSSLNINSVYLFVLVYMREALLLNVVYLCCTEVQFLSLKCTLPLRTLST